MQKTNFLRTARTAVSAIFVSATFTMAATSSPALAQNSLTIVTDWAPYGVHGPLFLAAQNGWFKDAGLDVTILDGKGSSSSLQLLGGEKVEYRIRAAFNYGRRRRQGLSGHFSRRFRSLRRQRNHGAAG